MKQINFCHLVNQYIEAKDVVIDEGYASEIDWQIGVDFEESSECEFLSEAAWVILSSGMRETVIRSKFESITSSFHGFKSAKDIIENASICKSEALKHFGHIRKIDAILSLAFRVYVEGYESIKKSIKYYGIAYLQSFDFIGPATSYHLAKNIGLNVSKPDRHLCRVADITGYPSVDELCVYISSHTGDSVSVVDLVIWRFATIRNDYLSWFANAHH